MHLTVLKRLVRGYFSAPEHLGALDSSTLAHTSLLGINNCLMINGKTTKMLIIENQSRRRDALESILRRAGLIAPTRPFSTSPGVEL